MASLSLHSRLRHRFPNAFWQGDPERREIALTFDDGPHTRDTPALLALLDGLGVGASFFHVGVRAAAEPALARQVADAGHQIGLHGYEHQSFLLKREEMLLEELARAQDILAQATGREPVAFNAVRPPFGHFTPSILNALLAAGYLPTMWTLVPFHWLQPAETTVRQVLNGVANGSILVLHETLPGPAVLDLAAAVLPLLIDAGYTFVTVQELWTNSQQKEP
jgi:peptidoglycan/xylan/chitin deacetylase (PgdA/CDA1 family)